MTPEERQLLETTARSLFKLKDDIVDRVAGMELVIHALFTAKGNIDIAEARLRIQADLLAMKGTPSAYLDAFVGRNQTSDSPLEDETGGEHGSE